MAVALTVVEGFPQGAGEAINARQRDIADFLHEGLANIRRLIDPQIFGQAPVGDDKTRHHGKQQGNDAVLVTDGLFRFTVFAFNAHRVRSR